MDTQGGGSLQDIATVGNNTNKILSLLVTAITSTFPRITGTFTCAAAATTTVTQTAIRATSVVLLTPTNAAAGTLMGGVKHLYVSALTVGASFTVATASGGAAAGTETFSYVVVNPA